ncbi:hypothetical protein ACQPW3_03795 [Actinosynnema sp. CA-248983]
MIFLRIVRVALIVLGIGVAALGIILITVEARVSGGPITATWTCKQEGTGTTARMNCKTEGATYAGPGGLVDLVSFLGLTVGGAALIGAAVAIGQFDRVRVAPAPNPVRPPVGPPLPPPGPGSGPHMAPGHTGAW